MFVDAARAVRYGRLYGRGLMMSCSLRDTMEDRVAVGLETWRQGVEMSTAPTVRLDPILSLAAREELDFGGLSQESQFPLVLVVAA